jgi:small GTP-binding protein
MRKAKVVLVGDASVGKTCITARATEGSFVDAYLPTVGGGISHLNVVSALGAITLNIWDTAGQERYETFVPLYARDAVGAVVVFDLTNSSSFEHLQKWFQLIQADTGNCEVILVGNKADLRNARTVTFETAQEFAEDHHVEYIESSAVTGEGISDIFNRLGELILKFPRPATEGPVHVETEQPPVVLEEEGEQPAAAGGGIWGALGTLWNGLPCSI